MTDDIGAWLDELGLGEYADVFRAHDIDVDVVGEFTVAELRELGITIGNAKRILRAVGTGATTQVPSSPSTERAAPSAERHQLSVAFCDLVGSATISEQLDPEDLRTLLDEYYRRCSTAARDHGGNVGKVVGDGVNLYFGYPTAIEQTAAAAVGAALDVIDAMEEMNAHAPAGAPHIQVRVGVHTGVAVVGEVGGAELEIVGEVPVIAARIQGVAQPGTVVVTEATARLLPPDIVLTDIGMHELKGLSAAVHVFSIQRQPELGAALLDAGHGPIEGRDAELASLGASWGLATRGRGQVVHVVGDAGIGKSQLARTMSDGIDPAQIMDYRCSPHRSGTPLWPFVDRLRRESGIGSVKGDEAGVTRLRDFLDAAGKPAATAEQLAMFATLLGLAPSNDRDGMATTPEELRENTFAAIANRLLERSAISPLLVRFEDIQWADPSTLELLGLLIKRASEWPILLLLTSRPEFRPPWSAMSPVATMTLRRLDDRDALAIIERVAGAHELPRNVVRRILALTDGVPLFVEELTRTVLESGVVETSGGQELVDSVLDVAIPSTLRDSLWARLDRLGPVREVAQVASVIGREFSVDTLAEAMGSDASAVRRDLATLHAAGLVLPRDTTVPGWFVFKHALVQTAAYDSMLRSRRRELHGRIATILERETGALAEHAEPLARHLELAGRADEAINAYMHVGDLVAAASGHEEALGHYRRALELAESLPRTHDGLERQLAVHSAIRNALVVLRGYASEEVAGACAVARSICDELGDTEQLFPVLWNLAGFHMLRGDHAASDEINDSLLEIAGRSRDDGLALLAHSTTGQTKHYQGRFAEAIAHLRQADALYDFERHRELAVRYAEEDPGAAALGYGAVTLWMLGDRAESRDWLERALRLSESLPYRTTHSLVVTIVVQLAYFRRSDALLQRALPVLEDLVHQRDFGFANPTAQSNLGWARVVGGDVDNGLRMLRAGIDGLARIGALATNPFGELLLANSLLRAGRAQEAVETLDTTLRTVRARGERLLEAELLRMCGEAHAAIGSPTSTVTTLMTEALDVAHELGARSLRLHAAISLTRYRAAGGDNDRRALRDAFGDIDSDLDDPDMREAESLTI